MAKQKARAIGIWIKDGTSDWDFLLAANTHTIALTNEPVEITGRPDRLTAPIWRQTQDGIKQYTISCEGIFTDDAKSEKWIKDRAMSLGSTGDFRIIVPNLRNIVGKFRVASLEYSGGGLTEPVTWSMTLESVGEPTRTPRPLEPVGLTAQRGNPSNQFRIDWTYAHDPSITNYQLKVGTGAWGDVTGSSAETTQISRTVNGTNITFQLRAVNADGNSDAASVTVA